MTFKQTFEYNFHTPDAMKGIMGVENVLVAHQKSN